MNSGCSSAGPGSSGPRGPARPRRWQPSKRPPTRDPPCGPSTAGPCSPRATLGSCSRSSHSCPRRPWPGPGAIQPTRTFRCRAPRASSCSERRSWRASCGASPRATSAATSRSGARSRSMRPARASPFAAVSAPRNPPASGAGQDHDPPVWLLADRLRRHVGVALEREVYPAPLEGGHRLELQHLARLDDALRGPVGDLAQLALPPAAIVLDVDEDPRPGPHLPRQHQVDEMLEGRKSLALAADGGPEPFAPLLAALLARRRLGWTRLGRGAVGNGRDLGCPRLAPATAVVASGSPVAVEWAVVASGRPIPIEPAAVVAPWPAVAVGAATVSCKAATVAIEAATPAAVVSVAVPRWRRRERASGSGLALGRGATELGARRGQDARRLGAHAQHTPAARGEDLEVQVVEPDAERLTGEAEGLLDGLAGELAVRGGGAHRRLPRRPWRPRWRSVAFADAVRSRDDRSGLGCAGAPAGRAVDVGAVGTATGKRGLWSTANAGVRPKSGNIPPQPVVKNCWTIWYKVDTIR